SETHNFDLLEYWNDKGLDRVEFLRLVIDRLDHQGWQNKTDAGWNEYDVQVYGSTMSVVQLVTVTETLGHGKQVLRCKLVPEGTFLAKSILWLMLGAELLFIGLLGQEEWWPYLLLITLPLFIWF